MDLRREIAVELERTVYVIAALPIALHGHPLEDESSAAVVRRAFTHSYWHPRSRREAAELVVGLLFAPLAVPLAALWYTARNGAVISRREGKGPVAQYFEQLRLYGAAGIFGPWYYFLGLYRDGARRAPTYLQRCETKRGIYALLKGEGALSPLGDKQKFAVICSAAGIRCAPCAMVVGAGQGEPTELPDTDLFAKPLRGCGGKGARRFDRVGPRTWSDGGPPLGDRELVAELRARGEPMIVQELVHSHPALAPLTAGALPTVRALTCLDEQGRPEVVATVFRMSLGDNHTVDNIHAGGIACAVSLDSGELGSASDLGSDARLGWHDVHPTTGARIKETRLPYWPEVKALAVKAHELFADRPIIGWDIAITADGPLLIEGNRGPDMDLMQRFMEQGFCSDHRLAELLAHHLRARGYS